MIKVDAKIAFLQRCLDLASRGFSHVAPNPQVGAVLIKNNRIISEGFHSYFGGPHAEVAAVENAKKAGVKDLSNTELFVSLEPCNHHGKTPPCTSLISDHGIKTVYAATADPAPEMSGKSFSILKKNGIHVENRSLAEGEKLIKDFTKYKEGISPYVILKWAESADGFIGKKEERVIISNPMSNHLVHRLRARVKGILVGSQTVMTDNPQLSTRVAFGPDPLPLIIDKNLVISSDFKIFENDKAPVVFHSSKSNNKNYSVNAELVGVEEFDFLSSIMSYCIENGISSLLVEGGARTISYFLESGLWNEIWQFKGANSLETGILAPNLQFRCDDQIQIGDDVLNRYYC